MSEEEVVAQLRKWNEKLKKPVEEHSLAELWSQKARDLIGKKAPHIDLSVLRSATFDSVLLDNSSRIEEEVMRVCSKIAASFSSKARINELKKLQLAACFEEIASMKELCRIAAAEVVDRFMPADSPNRQMIDVESVVSDEESKLLLLCTDFPAMEEFNSNVEREITQELSNLQKILQSSTDLLQHIDFVLQESFTITSELVMRRLHTQYGRIPDPMEVALQTKIQRRCEQQLSAHLLSIFEKVAHEVLWTEQFVPFAGCSEISKQAIAAVARSRADFSLEYVTADLVEKLGVVLQPGIDLERVLNDFRNSLTSKEKITILVSLCLFFSGMPSLHQIAANEKVALSLYTSSKRVFFRHIVNDLFGSGGIPIFNDWLLVRTVEELVEKMCQLLGPGQAEGMDRGASLSEIELESKPTAMSKTSGAVLKVYKKLSSYVLGTTERSVNIFEICELHDSPSPHTTIAISGWLSQADDMKMEWSHLWNYPNQSRVTALRWEAGKASKTVFTSFLHAIFFFSPYTAIPAALKLIRDHPFRDASFRADATGKMLAVAIRSGAFGRGPISLLGFSLGTRVIFSCLKDLAEDDRVYLMDVILLGGAAPSEAAEWITRRNAIAGRLINVYSRRDKILTLIYRVAKLHKPIGIEPIEAGESVENFDASDYILQHQDHRKHLDRTLSMIKYQP